MARGRTPTVINKVDFQAALTQLETTQQFRNRSELWAAFSQTEYAKNHAIRPLQPQTAMMFADKENVSIITIKGRKGRLPGQGLVASGQRRKRIIDSEYRINILKDMPKDQQEKLVNVIDKACNGSMKAAVKLKCLDCTNYQKSEISGCTIVGCGLHPYRPYRKALNVIEIEKEDEKEAIKSEFEEVSNECAGAKEEVFS